jgi:DNA helicase II / ATP-dependent DNA helicase PcrA
MGQLDFKPQVVAEPWKEGGPILLLAGPGTGKTHQLALRIKDLVENKAVSPQRITVITFTKEAAENMRRRISNEASADVYVAPEKRPARITTMHSLGLDIIRGDVDNLGLSEDFQVMTNPRLRRILFRDAAFLCGHAESDAQRADILRQKTYPPMAGSVEEHIIQQYEGILRANNAIDYDDQILLALKVLSENKGACSQCADAAHHLLVDEYQDINLGQRQLIALLSRQHPAGLFVVGDDDQSIYSFRGGTPKYVREFHIEHGKEAKVLCLVQSRRCPDKIVHSALNVVARFDPSRKEKPAPTFNADKQNAGPVLIHDVASDDQEAGIICEIVKGAIPKHSVLILIPARQYADKIKRALRKKRIQCSHQVSIDDTGLALLQEIDDWIGEQTDSFSLRLCIEYICDSGEIPIPTSRSRKEELKAMRSQAMSSIASLWGGVIEKRDSLWEVLVSRKDNSQLFSDLYERLNAFRGLEAANVSEFLSKATRDLRLWSNRESLMKEIRGWIDELHSHTQNAEGQVRILTLQAAKGLEADIVCVVGLNEGIIPRAGATPADIGETARLTYVSMTRARKELHLFHARTRDASITYLKASYSLKPSRFLSAIEKTCKELRYHHAPSKKKSVGP